jgi:hypothetical protein
MAPPPQSSSTQTQDANYQNVANQQIAADLQRHVADSVNLADTSRSLASLQADHAAASVLRQKQTVQTYGSEALQDNVQMVTVLNESLNANQYLQTIMTAESGRIGGIEKGVKNEQFKLRNKLMMNEYLIGYYSVAAFVVQLTMVTTLLLLLPAALWRAGVVPGLVFGAVVLVLVLVYMAALVATVARTSMRRTDAWNELNWNVGKKFQKQLDDASRTNVTCDSGGAAGSSGGQMSCSDAAAQYASLYADSVLPPSRLPGVSSQSRSWADYLIGGQTNYWPGEACYTATSCDDAKAIYAIMYPGPYGPGVTLNQDHLNHPEHVWASASNLCV